ncbi:MAG: FAD-dependent oxidoreductase [Arthrobacter sp.]|jgi:sarcosine oxidase|nr:FAD-dependent oxidoreductase [Arthrobacter sp.]
MSGTSQTRDIGIPTPQEHPMENASHVVIGAGLIGASTAWHLAERGHDVLLLERDVPASEFGSSHGSARIFRYAYPNPFYAQLVVDSEPHWARLSELAGVELITRCGALDHGEDRNPALLAKVLTQVGVEHELLSAAEATERFPQFAFTTDVLWQPGAGVLDAQTTVETMVAAAQAAGTRVRSGWEVDSVVEHSEGLLITAADGRKVLAGHVTVAAGGFLPWLLPRLPLSEAFRAALPAFEVTQENAFHFPFGEDFPAERWPTVIHKIDGWNSYALPGGRDAGFTGLKLAEYHAGRALTSAKDQDGVIPEAVRERVVARVRALYPGLVAEPYAETTCLFTMTPTEDFVLEREGRVTIFSACSGHGAKFAPLMGSFGADVATGAAPAPAPFRVGAAVAQ